MKFYLRFQAALPVLLLSGAAFAAKQQVEVEVAPAPGPELSIKLTSCCGGPTRYDYEDGTICVVRQATGRKCTLDWKAKEAVSVSISPEWQGLNNPLNNPAGSYQFWYQGMQSGDTKRFTVTATNEVGGTTEKTFTLKRLSCFLPGTQVLMCDGSYKKIEDVKAGDQVSSYDVAAGKVSCKGVIGRTERVANEGYYVMNNDLKVTPMHIFYGNGDWVRTQDLKPGDSLLSPNGAAVKIESMKLVEEPATVYNLITEGPENYFVRMGNEDVLVHNQKAKGNAPDKGILPGTMVVLAGGRYVPIEKVKVGDKLVSFDKENKRYTLIRVNGTSNQEVAGYLLINGKLKIGKEHPVYSVTPESVPEGGD